MDITTQAFDYLRAIVGDASGIVLEPGKEYLVESRLAPLLRQYSFEDYDELVRKVKSPSGRELKDAVVDAMTTNETSFFRDIHPWEALKTDILPELIEARQSVKTLTIWCAASSSGQEPYTLAMVIKDNFPEVAADWRVRIMGTDLSPTMVARCTAGRFSQLEVNRGLPVRSLMTHFERDGNDWQVSEDLRRMVTFREGNLNDEASWKQIPLVDGVFVRNVLIYFNNEDRRKVLERVRGRLRSDGFLMLGSSESAVGAENHYERCHIGKTVLFRPVADKSAPTLASAGR